MKLKIYFYEMMKRLFISSVGFIIFQIYNFTPEVGNIFCQTKDLLQNNIKDKDRGKSYNSRERQRLM